MVRILFGLAPAQQPLTTALLEGRKKVWKSINALGLGTALGLGLLVLVVAAKGFTVVTDTALWAAIAKLRGLLGWLGGGLVVVVAMTGLWAAIAMLESFFRRTWFRAFRNYDPTYKDIWDGFDERSKTIKKQASKQLDKKDQIVAASATTLATELNLQIKADNHIPDAKKRAELTERTPTNYRELGCTLRDIIGRLGELENRALVLPPPGHATEVS
jgi:hypothetical protein